MASSCSRGGELEILGRMPWSSNATFLVSVAARRASRRGRSTSPAAVSARCGTSPAGSSAARWPPTSSRPRSGWRRARDGAPRSTGPTARARSSASSTPTSSSTTSPCSRSPRYERPAPAASPGFDLLANNADRKGGHVLVDDDGAHLGDRPRPVLPRRRQAADRRCGTSPASGCPKRSLAACERLADEMPSTLDALLEPDEREALSARAARLRRRPVFPAPRDDYRAYPWPLV